MTSKALDIYSMTKEIADEASKPHVRDLEDELYKLKAEVARHEALIKLSKLLSHASDIKTLQKNIDGWIKDVVGAERVVLFTLNKNSKQLEANFENAEDSYSFELDDATYVGKCGQLKRVLKLTHLDNDLLAAREKKKSNLQIHSLLLVPLCVKGELIGVLEAVNSTSALRSFDEDDIYFADAIGDKIAKCLENFELIAMREKQFYQVCQSMGEIIFRRDAYTGGHTKRVAFFSEQIGIHMGLSRAELYELKLSAVLHDIGKVGIDDKILKKCGRLTPEEFNEMKRHPHLGYKIVSQIDGLERVSDGVRYHHERYDGKGYPYGLKGEEIPLIAQIISVADTFDAMVSNRPYRKGLNPLIAYNEIVKNAGTQFSIRVVKAFKKYFDASLMKKRVIAPLREVA